jgi:hypothetical protein
MFFIAGGKLRQIMLVVLVTGILDPAPAQASTLPR